MCIVSYAQRTQLRTMSTFTHMKLFNKILNYQKLSRTYTLGLLQAKAYRVLKRKTGAFLEAYTLTTIEWALLGLVYEKKAGEAPTELGAILGVKGPFVTRLIAALQKKKLVTIEKSPTDSRAKIVMLTAHGRTQVEHIESLLRIESKTWIKGVSTRDIISYISVLNAIARDE